MLPVVPARPASVVTTRPGSTESVTGVELLLPAPLLTTQRNWLSRKSMDTPVTVRAAVEVPVYIAPSVRALQSAPPSNESCHWYAGAGDPSATIVKTAVCPEIIGWPVGCVVINGAIRGRRPEAEALKSLVPAKLTAFTQ